MLKVGDGTFGALHRTDRFGGPGQFPFIFSKFRL
jgi:hypothetical protein